MAVGRRGRRRASPTLRFANWPLYIDVDEATKARPTLDQFTDETGIMVEYFEEINDNAEYFAKVQGPPRRARGSTATSSCSPTTRASRGLLIEQEWVQKLDKELIPNIENLIDAQASPPFDPDQAVPPPWQSGMTGIAWNEDLTGPVESIEQLLDDLKLKGKVSMLMELADSVGLVMLANGDDPASVSDETFNRAADPVSRRQSTRADRPLHGQRLRPAADARGVRGVRRLVGRHDPAAGRQSQAEVGRPQGRRDDLDGQHADPDGRERADGVDVHELRLRPGRGRADRRVRQLRAAGEGHGEDKLVKIDLDLASNTLIIPDDALLAQLHQYDSAALNNDAQITKWQSVLGQ